ncbi:MAG: hypothetical protein MUD01_17765 [Chloroflexaceae bacterium]|jgi:hypothetical protein|nr:hypothetical protein [Chloroflexaceae bacterium]
MTDSLMQKSDLPLLQHQPLLCVRLLPVAGGLMLCQGDEPGEAVQLYVPTEEVAALVLALQHHASQHSPELDELLPELGIWRVTGTILYDDDYGEEALIDLDMTCEAVDEAEAVRLTLEQLQERYMGAAWDGTPVCERQFGGG